MLTDHFIPYASVGEGLPVNLDPYYTWRDHTFPILAGLDSATYGIMWQDYRYSPTNTEYAFGLRTVQYSASSFGLTISTEMLTAEGGTFVTDRDIDSRRARTFTRTLHRRPIPSASW